LSFHAHGRIEVDDSSIKRIGSDGLITRLPVATLAALTLGPGTFGITPIHFLP
jgi:CRISP-associated protein Cas1